MPENDFVTHAEFEATLKNLPDTMKLAVMEGVKAMVPELMERIDEKYGEKLKSLREEIYGDGSKDNPGLKIIVDRLTILSRAIPGLVQLKWRIWSLITASGIVGALSGFIIDHFWRK